MHLDPQGREFSSNADSPTRPAERDLDSAGGAAEAAPRVLVVDAGDDTLGLLHEWLTAAGYGVEAAGPDGRADGAPFGAVIVDVPFPRESVELLCRVAAEHPGTPLLVLSPMFFASVECTGRCAHSLGVAGVLPKPLRREALLEAMRKVMQRSA